MSKKPISEQNQKRLEYLSYYLRELRYNENLTQRELSQQMSLHRNTVLRAENSKNLTLLSVFELADTLNISPKDLFLDIE
jgi:transcriptional regulator with XRE-family HTH domain